MERGMSNMHALTTPETNDGPTSWITDRTSWRRVAKSWLSCIDHRRSNSN